MNNELLAMLDYIEQERGVSKAQLIEAVEKALLAASRKAIHPASDLSVKVDRKTGEIRAWAKLKVVDAFANNDEITLADIQKQQPDARIGDIVTVEVTPANFGRIAAMTAKQAIKDQIRRAERETVQDEFKDQIGEIVNGTVRRIDSGNILVDLQKAEGIIPQKERIPSEQYMPGERINALLTKVDVETSGPSLILSRGNAQFLRKLFEREVSEIHDGVVEIVAVARDAGTRSKIAVRSNDSRVDPVGACVGMRGMRVKNITNELGGERVDIIHYSDNLEEYTRNVLHPAKPERIEFNHAKKQMSVYVDQENSRLAFGKRAQNIKLAQRLMQWTIEIVTEDPNAEFEEKKQQAVENLAGSLGLDQETAALLVNNGYLTVDVIRADVNALAAIEGITPAVLEQIRNALAD